MLFGAAGGSSIALSEMLDRIPPPYPMISFMVTGIEEIVDSLKARGASFRPPVAARFAGVEGKAVGDVMDFGHAKSAFLKDPEGNVIALNKFIG
ncbi:VOC family protein [Arthrobacter sp. NPDC056886]|uniref:VOC family protein n=1 Tax=Arthrobacter sp. NPDC056886 TaxID=3345960 RepID=UPI003673593C